MQQLELDNIQSDLKKRIKVCLQVVRPINLKLLNVTKIHENDYQMKPKWHYRSIDSESFRIQH